MKLAKGNSARAIRRESQSESTMSASAISAHSSALVETAVANCADAARRERDQAGGHPGKLLTASRRLSEAQAALAAGAAHAREGLERARALYQEALEKEQRSRVEAEAARGRGERLVAKSLRRTERRAARTLERARELMDTAARRDVGCTALAEALGRGAAALEDEGHEVLAQRCSDMAGMTVRVDISAIRAAGGAAWGPAIQQRVRPAAPRVGALRQPALKVEAISTPSRDLALQLLRSILGEQETLPNTGLPDAFPDVTLDSALNEDEEAHPA